MSIAYAPRSKEVLGVRVYKRVTIYLHFIQWMNIQKKLKIQTKYEVLENTRVEMNIA